METELDPVLLLGKNIKRMREIKEMTQQEVEVAAGLPIGNLSKIERGKVDIQFSKLEKIARALQVQIGQLYFIKY